MMNGVETNAGATASPAAESSKALKRVPPKTEKRPESRSKSSMETVKSPERSARKKPPVSSSSRAGTKSAKILNLIGRPAGASLAAIMKATRWQAHSVRGFLSTALKRYQVKIDSTKNEAGERVYRITR